jgi:NADP-dependent 3-hydroxy acid dehydrogenase YdfG
MNGTDSADNRSRKVFISGGSSGIGMAMVRLFAAHGWEVATVDINRAEFPREVHFTQGDLASKETVARLKQQLDSLNFEPDILVLNAGKGIHQKLSEGDPDEWEHVIQLNLLGALRLLRTFLPAMIQKKTADVVFINSVSARNTYPYGGVYAATKAALDMVAETLRLEQQPQLRVSRIFPGVVDTSFFENMIDGGQNPESIGWGALSPEHIAETILYVLNQPHEVAMNEIVIRPVAQPM